MEKLLRGNKELKSPFEQGYSNVCEKKLNNALATEITVAMRVVLGCKIILQGQESTVFLHRDSSIQRIRSLAYLIGFAHNNRDA